PAAAAGNCSPFHAFASRVFPRADSISQRRAGGPAAAVTCPGLWRRRGSGEAVRHFVSLHRRRHNRYTAPASPPSPRPRLSFAFLPFFSLLTAEAERSPGRTQPRGLFPPSSAQPQNRMSTIQNLQSFDPFADATKGDDLLPAGTEDYIHIRIQQRNGRKTLTTVQGIADDYDKKKLVKAFKKKFACNGTVIEHPEYGEVIQLQGDQRKNICQFLLEVSSSLPKFNN
ncbi:hypothetical protein JD844_002716, partial [Phrynosoma platyrhinos]